MEIKYEIKSKFLLTEKEVQCLEYLRLKGGHIMKELRKRFKIGIVTLAWKSGEIVGWSLVFERDNEPTFFCFVSEKYRRLGIGTQLYNINKAMFGDILYTSKHDGRSKKFYESFNVK